MKEGDSFFENKWVTFVTIISFTWQLVLILYFYLVTYQFLLFSVTVARSYKWSLEYITRQTGEAVSDDITLSEADLIHDKMKLAVRKFEHLRVHITEYNGLFSGLLFFVKALLVVQIAIMSYIPLRKDNPLPFSTTIILVALTLHHVIQVIIVLIEMGKVYKASGQFTDEWMRHLVERINEYVDYCANHVEISELDVDSVDYGNLVNKHLRIRHDKRDKEGGKWSGFALKSLLETCKPFGFDCGGCYTVTPNTILTFFSIVTSYLIILLQLQI